VEYAIMVWDPSKPKKDQIHKTGTERAARFVHNNYTDRTPGWLPHYPEYVHVICNLFASPVCFLMLF
jgi:hypothetical protein